MQQNPQQPDALTVEKEQRALSTAADCRRRRRRSRFP